MCGWAGAAVMGAVLGICCINPDGGDYGVWLQQASQQQCHSTAAALPCRAGAAIVAWTLHELLVAGLLCNCSVTLCLLGRCMSG